MSRFAQEHNILDIFISRTPNFEEFFLLGHTADVGMEWGLIIVAAAVGFLVGLTGVGGGALMTPLLIGVFGIPLPIAVATDLLFATATKVVGVGFHHRVGNINWRVASRLWAGSIPGAVVGVGLLIVIADSPLSAWLSWPLLALVLATAVILAKRAITKPAEQTLTPLPASPKTTVSNYVAPAGGFGIGLAVAITSVGAGALGMALLVKLSPPHTKPQELVGTDLVHAIPIALIAGIAYGFAGLVSWGLLGILLIGSIPGVLVGSALSNKVPSRPMNAILAMILTTAAVLVVAK
jgi:hypothetical protein